MPIPLGILAVAGAGAAGSLNYFYIMNTNDGNEFLGINVDSSGNPHIVGRIDNDTYLVKTDSLGNVTWQRRLASASTELLNGVDVNSSGDVYVSGYTYTSGNSDFFIAKYNSSGTIQWQRRLGDSVDQFGYRLALDASGNPIIAGEQSVGTGWGAILVKYDTNGNVTFSRQYKGSSDRTSFNAVATDSSSNIYALGYHRDDGDDIVLQKVDSSGTRLFTTKLELGTTNYGQTIALDSTGAIYGGGWIAGAVGACLIKFDTSGNVSWQRTLADSNQLIYRGSAIDSSNNIYMVGVRNSSPYQQGVIAKYNSSGTIQWQRAISGAGSISLSDIMIDSNNNMNISGRWSGLVGDKPFVAVLPTDGSKTATYSLSGSTLNYFASSFTDAAGSFTSSSITLNADTQSFTNTTTTLTDTAPSISQTKINA